MNQDNIKNDEDNNNNNNNNNNIEDIDNIELKISTNIDKNNDKNNENNKNKNNEKSNERLVSTDRNSDMSNASIDEAIRRFTDGNMSRHKVDKGKRKKALIKVVIFIIFTILIAMLFSTILTKQILDVCKWLDDQGQFGILLYIICYVIFLIVCIPSSLLDLASGFIFGFWIGVFISLLSKLIGASCTFIISKTLAREYLEKNLLSQYQWMRAMKYAMKKKPYNTTFLLRLCAVPAALKNYGFGVLPVGYQIYITVSFIVWIPFTIAIVLAGAKADDFSEIIGGASLEETIFFAIGILSIFLVIYIIRRQTTKFIQEAQERQSFRFAEFKLQGYSDDEARRRASTKLPLPDFHDENKIIDIENDLKDGMDKFDDWKEEELNEIDEFNEENEFNEIDEIEKDLNILKVDTV